jgi:hypothetical protein
VDDDERAPDAAQAAKQAHYQATTERNRVRHASLSRSSRKTVWGRFYLPVHPRSVTVSLVGGFLYGASRNLPKGEAQLHVERMIAIALANPADEQVVPCVAKALQRLSAHPPHMVA